MVGCWWAGDCLLVDRTLLVGGSDSTDRSVAESNQQPGQTGAQSNLNKLNISFNLA